VLATERELSIPFADEILEDRGLLIKFGLVCLLPLNTVRPGASGILSCASDVWRSGG
jgi:hypothetical protein